jgi:methyltransferase (TIGR00027 family)
MLKSVRRIVALGALTAFSVAPLVIRAVEPGKPAVTALETTAYRAIGARHPDPAIRNDDHLAERFLGAEERAILKAEGSQAVLDALELDTAAAWKSLGPGIAFATAVHVRTRYIDEVFRESLGAGATQAVILGAGLDSRAYRFGDVLKGARVFEVDFPPTQEYKKKRVREILKALPPHVVYAPIDFTKDDLATVLKQAGYDTTKKTVFVWEGVTFYIPESAVNGTLRFVASNSAPGSRIVFDYFVKSGLETPGIVALNKRLTALGEPFIFGMPDENRDRFVARQGLRMISEVGINELRRRYLPDGFGDQTPASLNYLCVAEVPARQ